MLFIQYHVDCTLHFRCKKFNFTATQEHHVQLSDNSNPLVELIKDVIPVLNGRDSQNNVAYLGPNRTRIHRYLVILYIAKFVPSFTLWGKNFDNSTFFTLYSLGNVAKAFKNPIHYDRSRVAVNIYRKAEEKGLVEIKKVNGATYITTTTKGDALCMNVLKDFITLARIHGESPSDDRFISKGGSSLLNYKASQYFKALVQRIDELNNQFEEEIDY
jgi:hypothetical protein